MQELPWPLYKIKVGTDDDVAIVRELRKHTDAVFELMPIVLGALSKPLQTRQN